MCHRPVMECPRRVAASERASEATMKSTKNACHPSLSFSLSLFASASSLSPSLDTANARHCTVTQVLCSPVSPFLRREKKIHARAHTRELFIPSCVLKRRAVLLVSPPAGLYEYLTTTNQTTRRERERGKKETRVVFARDLL